MVLDSERLDDRARVGWWLFVGLLAAVAGYLVYSFVGLFVLGVFGYYATRPLHRRVRTYVDSESVAAGATVLLILVPVLALAVYAGVQVVHVAQQQLGAGGGATVRSLLGSLRLESLPAGQRQQLFSALQDPMRFFANPGRSLQSVARQGAKVVSAFLGAILLVALAFTLSYFLLANGDELSDSLRELLGGRDTTAYAYAAAVDEDLETVFFGNLVFAVIMAAVAAVVYGATNLLAPAGLAVPMVLVLAVLTGAASLIPIVVGKVVYLPVVGYLALQAVRADGNQLPFVGAVLVVYVLLLDVLPQGLLQPYVTSRNVDAIVLLFGYVLGPMLFGWYGFFLLPLVFVVMLEAIRIPLPELIRGERLTPTVSLGEDAGADVRRQRKRARDADEGESDSGDG